MSNNFADRLCRAVREKGSCAVAGIDPRPDMLPSTITAKHSTPDAAFLAFGKGVIDAVEPYVCAIKVQVAFYEALGLKGLGAYAKTLTYARKKGLIVIGDVKRGDIGSTVSGYAAGHLTPGSDFEADAITVNSYFGYDGIEPFLSLCSKEGKGIFILLRTSNPSAKQVQDVRQQGLCLWERLAVLISQWGDELVGESGYSSVGAVVGATYPEEALKARDLAPSTILLIPGYGAQGGKASDIAGCMDEDGLGAIVNSSRKIIYAFRGADGEEAKDWQAAVAQAAQATRDDLAR